MVENHAPEKVVVELTAEELALIEAALRMLRSTLGREEAGELHEVSTLLARLEAIAPPS